MTKTQLAAARKLLLALHAQADQTPRLHGRRDAYRTALACVEIVQAAIGTQPPVKFSPGLATALKRAETPETVPGDFRPTLYAPSYARTELATVLDNAMAAA